MKIGDEDGVKRFVERIGSLHSTRESVATILCQVSEKSGSDWKSQLSEGSFVFIVGKPVDEPSDVDYVPSRFSFKDDTKIAAKARQTIEGR